MHLELFPHPSKCSQQPGKSERWEIREDGDLEHGVAGDVEQVDRIGIYFRGRISRTY